MGLEDLVMGLEDLTVALEDLAMGLEDLAMGLEDLVVGLEDSPPFSSALLCVPALGRSQSALTHICTPCLKGAAAPPGRPLLCCSMGGGVRGGVAPLRLRSH